MIKETSIHAMIKGTSTNAMIKVFFFLLLHQQPFEKTDQTKDK